MVNVMVMVQLNVLVNMGWNMETQSQRDDVLIIIAHEVLRGLRELDDYDREHCGSA